MPTQTSILLFLPGAIISGIIVYFVFSSLFIPVEVTVAISVIISVLIFGLSVYCAAGKVIEGRRDIEKEVHSFPWNVSFILLYVILITIAFFAGENNEIFIPWEQIIPNQVATLIAALLLCLFAPGLAMVSIIDRKQQLKTLPKLLISYLLSVFITALTGYISAYSGLAHFSLQLTIYTVHIIILSSFFLIKYLDKEIVTEIKSFSTFNGKDIVNRIRIILTNNGSVVLVFVCLFALVVLSTYYLYEGKIIGDQWYHHGRALLFLSGNFREIAVSGAESDYPPFSHGFLATFFSLSGLPSANAYASLGFLNIMPVLAFYYVFSKWIPHRFAKAALLASVLFMLGSGFGWLYLLSAGISVLPDPLSALEAIGSSANKTFDIWVPNTFIIAGHPDIATGLITIALPAGFVLLGLIRDLNAKARLNYALIMALVTTLAYLSHPEFGIFIVVASLVPVFFRLRERDDVFAAMLAALSLAVFFAFFFPGGYYSRGIAGIPFIFIYLIFVASMWIVYRSKIIDKVSHRSRATLVRIKLVLQGRIRLILGVALVCIVSYLYSLSFIIWYYQLSEFDIRFNTLGFAVVPWHLYPIRLGVTGLIGLSFILSYFFKKFEKEIFVFGIIAIIAFLLLPQYLEVRSNKYVMTAMDAFASLMLIYLFQNLRNSQRKTLASGFIIGLVIVTAGLSTLLYVGFVALSLENYSRLEEGNLFDSVLPRRAYFPSDSEMQMLRFLRDNLSFHRDENVVVTENELNKGDLGLRSLLEGFLGMPISKISQNKLGLKESSVEGFYELADYSGAKYVLIKKSDLTVEPSKALGFALENMRRVYEDENYVILALPSLQSPLPGGGIALIASSSDNNTNQPISSRLQIQEVIPKSLPNDFPSEDNSTVLESSSEIWYDVAPGDNPNYIKSTSKALGRINVTDSHHGILWDDGFRRYYAFVMPSSLILMTLDDGKYKAAPIDTPAGKWVTIEVIYSNGMINVFLDDKLQIQLPQVSPDFHISRAGIRTWNEIAEFSPLEIGRTLAPDESEFVQGQNHNYDYYYTLSALAMSQASYEIFENGDSSALSKRKVILTSDVADAGPYMDYVQGGGTVIVLNSNDDFKKDGFGNLLCIKPLNESPFDYITNSADQTLNVSGLSRNVSVYCPSSSVTSYYMEKGQRIAPFVIEREFGKGKIYYFNTVGYFESISKSPERYFQTLENLANFIDLRENTRGNYTSDNMTRLNSAPVPHFIGNATFSGPVTIGSSSLLLPSDENVTAELISVLAENRSADISERFDRRTNFGNVTIKDLSIYGSYNVKVNAENLEYVPFSAPYSYLPVEIPSGSNMTIGLSSGSADMYIGDNLFEISKDTGIVINRTKNPVSFLLKNPVIDLTEKGTFYDLRSHYPDRPAVPWTDNWPLQVHGKATIRLDHVTTDVNNPGRYITYFDWIDVDPRSSKTNNTTYRGQVLTVPWDQIMVSYPNTTVATSIILVAAIVLYVRSSHITGRKIRRLFG